MHSGIKLRETKAKAIFYQGKKDDLVYAYPPQSGRLCQMAPVFDQHGATLKAKGSKEGYLFHSTDDPNEFVILLEWDNREKARQFVLSEDLRKSMQRSGVSDQTDEYFLDKLERVSA